jgi:hypothetical protein
LFRITQKCWNAWSPETRPNEEGLPWYLQIGEFSRNPGHAIEALYTDHQLEEGLTFLQVHESVELARMVERRLKSPLRKLHKVHFRALQILQDDFTGKSETTIFQPHALPALVHLAHYHDQGSPERRTIDDLLDRWIGVRNDFETAAKYLRSLVGVLRRKHARAASILQTAEPSLKPESPGPASDAFRKLLTEATDPEPPPKGSAAPVDQKQTPETELTAVERAMQIYLRDPNQSLREVARKARCDPGQLSRDPRFRRLREAHAGTIPKGSKSKQGDMEAEAEEE